MSAQAPAVPPGINEKHDILGVEDVEQDGKVENTGHQVIVTEEDVGLIPHPLRG